MVLHTRASYPIGHVITGKYWLDLRPGDLHWNMSETGWAKAAWSNLFGPLEHGRDAVHSRCARQVQPREALEFLQRYPITTLCAPPTIYRCSCSKISVHIPSRRCGCIGAGEPLNPR
ncbi:MAG: hypothetical protein U0Z44_00835 [Kouleothrix sp.]